jgi:hypothetical protein
MKALTLILAVAVTCAGCYLAAIRRHTEIKRPVTSQELVGRWVLSTNSLKNLMVDGFTPNKGEEVAITLRSNNSYSMHTLSPSWDGRKRVVDRVDSEGRWAVTYAATKVFRNELVLRSSQDAVSFLYVALDSQTMILWKSWGRPRRGR